MAYEDWPAEEFGRLSERAKQVASWLAKAEKVVEKLDGKELNCELRTIASRIDDAFVRVKTLMVEVDEEAIKAAKALHEKGRGK